jgi:beta-ketodecanoyl-[acyl-carrier-protein] synthase
VVIEKNSQSKNKFKILDTKLKTSFSNNIRNNYGYMNAIEDKEYSESELLFVQNGRKVFKEVMPFVSSLILDQLNAHSLSPDEIEQYWLHQANINMNSYVIKKLLGDDFPPERAPIILDEYANTSSAGSIIAFHKFNHLTPGQKGIICSFGAGYSICSILLEKE